MKATARVMMVGTTEKSGGGVTSVIKLIKKMPVWNKYNIYWLGTQTQQNKLWRVWYAIRAAALAPLLVWKFDIVHFHFVPGTCQIIQLPQLLCALLYHKKVIIEVHVGNQLNNNTNNKFFKWWLNKADLVLLLSRRWEILFHEKFDDIATPTDILYNACELGPSVRPKEKCKLILMAGWLNDNKAPDLLIKAWAKLKNQYPDWHVMIIGNGEVERFKKMADDLGLRDSIDFPGYLIGEDKENIFRKSSIYCMCSYKEGFPMVVLESWAPSIAVVTTPVGGLPDVIQDGKNCLVFPFGDSNKLADCLEKLINDDNYRRTLGVNGRKIVEESFSLNSVNVKLDSLYERILNK